MRTNYEMTADDLQSLLDAMKPVPMIMLQCGSPSSQQENANAAWARLGEKMNFDPMTVRPTGRGDRFFSAVALPPKAPAPKPHVRLDGNKWCATNPDFINLQESPAGFGDTPAEAIAALAKE